MGSLHKDVKKNPKKKGRSLNLCTFLGEYPTFWPMICVNLDSLATIY